MNIEVMWPRWNNSSSPLIRGILVRWLYLRRRHKNISRWKHPIIRLHSHAIGYRAAFVKNIILLITAVCKTAFIIAPKARNVTIIFDFHSNISQTRSSFREQFVVINDLNIETVLSVNSLQNQYNTSAIFIPNINLHMTLKDTLMTWFVSMYGSKSGPFCFWNTVWHFVVRFFCPLWKRLGSRLHIQHCQWNTMCLSLQSHNLHLNSHYWKVA